MDKLYEAKLPHEGSVIITKKGWYINYTFPCLQSENGISQIDYHIPGDNLERHLELLGGYLNQYLVYQNQSFEHAPIPCAMDFTIHLGGFQTGVCLKGIYRPVKSREDYDKIVEDFAYARRIVEEYEAGLT